MEIVMIEARTYEAMMARFEQFIQKMDNLCQRYGDKDLKQWLDGQDVCMILNISKRTLQTLRDNGRLGYTMIGHKTYYKAEDVQGIVGNMTKGKEVLHE